LELYKGIVKSKKNNPQAFVSNPFLGGYPIAILLSRELTEYALPTVIFYVLTTT
jgi:hypothetical protein